MLKLKYAFLSLVLLAFLPSCAQKPQTQEFFAMNTVMSITADKKHEAAVKDTVSLIEKLSEKFDYRLEGSDVYRLNLNETADIESDTLELLHSAAKYGELTGGAFDITLLSLSNLWGVSGGKETVPDGEAVRQALEKCGSRFIELSGNKALLTGGAGIDAGGIAKGYASDKAVEYLKSRGVDSAVLSLGGNIAVIGKKSDGSDFSVGIQDPRGKSGEIIGSISASDEFLVTSGDYERYFMKDGKRYHHIFDPKTGYPADSGLISVTIVCKSGTAADCLSTALFVMGLDRAMEFWSAQGSFEAVFVTADKRVLVTDGLKERFIFSGGDNGYEYGS